MWERSGGNKQMVDMLVEAWNTKNPDCKIKLTYIPHTEMVGKIAQGIASGEVPDLMGMDLIYAPQFEKAQQLVDITDRIKDWPELEDRQQGPHDGGDLRGQALRRAAVRRRLGPVLQQGSVHPGRARPGEAADQPGRAADVRRQDHRAGRRRQGLLPARQLRRLQHLHRRPADVGLRRDDRGGRPGDEPLVGDGVKQVLQFTRDMVKAGNVHEGDRAENGETFHLQFGSGKVGMMGTGNFNITLARQQNPDMKFGIALLPGMQPNSSASFIGGDLVVVPKGSERVADAVNFMKFLLSDEVQVEVYAKALNLTTRTDMVDNKYFEAEPLVQDVAKALDVGPHAVHADVLRADQLAAGSVAADAADGPTTPTTTSTRSSPTPRRR